MNSIFFKTAYRNIRKNAGFSAINIFGLSLSLAVGLLIAFFLQQEYGFDKGNSRNDQMYRLLTTFKYPNSPESTYALSSAMMGPYLYRQCGEMEQYLRVVTGMQEFLCKSDRREVVVGKSLEVDSSFFSFFNFPLLRGEPSQVFSHPENIVLTKNIATTLFGEQDPIGRTLEHSYTLPTGVDTTVFFVVSGVLQNLPFNSHLQFDALTLLNEGNFAYWNKDALWHGVVANTYFKLYSGETDFHKLEQSFPEMLQKEMPNSHMINLSLQPFKEIHLGSMHLAGDENNQFKSDRKYLGILVLIGVFILSIGSINFANLSTVLAMKRGLEVGVHKSLGASGANVLKQFLGEAVLMSVCAGCLSLLWVELLRNPFGAMLGRQTGLPVPLELVAGFICFTLLLGLCSGLYPALQAKKFSALQAFQKQTTALSVKKPFIQGLVVLQFALSGMLIMGSLVSYRQLQFIKNKDLGFRYDQVLEMDLGAGNWMHSVEMKKELSAIPGVLAVCGSDNSIGTINAQNGVLVRNVDTRSWENHPMSIIRADPEYFSLFEVQFVAGRAPTQEGAVNEKEYVVNESFVKKMGWQQNAVGQEIMRAGYYNDDRAAGRIVGVIKDIHHNTLRHAIEPICIQASQFTPIVSVKIEISNTQKFLDAAAKIWPLHIKDRPLKYEFKDEHFARIYDAENRLGRALLLGTLLSIAISSLGLLALSSIVTGQRTKEIGIRKVLGASTEGIVGMLSKDFLKLVSLAILIAAPLAYVSMNKWLQDFAYRIHIGWWVIALTGVIMVAVAFLTISFQAVKAALANPVKSLRNE